MEKQQFDNLAVGDKVCNTRIPTMWGYVEDIDKENGMLEFDIEEAVFNMGMTVNKGIEIRSHYLHLTLLEKAVVNTALSVEAKDAIADIYKTVTDAQNAIIALKNILKI